MMNRSANYMLDMLEEEDENAMDQLKSFEQYGTGGLAEFSAYDALDGPGFSTARDQAAATGLLKVQPCLLQTLTDEHLTERIEEEKDSDMRSPGNSAEVLESEEQGPTPNYDSSNFKENIRSDARLLSIFNLIDDTQLEEMLKFQGTMDEYQYTQ